MSDTSQVDAVLEQLHLNIDQLLLLLSQKEKFVIQRRFGIDSKSRATLEEIGQHFHVTRERVRQIESNALQKLRRNVENSPVHSLNLLAYQHLTESGGVVKENLLIGRLLTKHDHYSYSALQLILALDKRFERVPNTVQYHPYVKFKTLSIDEVREVAEKAYELLEKEKIVKKIADLAIELRNLLPASHLLQKEVLKAIFQTNKSFKVIDEEAGLIHWRHINPKTIRDKIYFTLRRKGKPLHFIEIANAIAEQQFDKKTLNLQAIHNELIRYGDFILIGRGIYALQEWGYQAGTVAEVIEELLKENKSMHQQKIIEEVLKQRKVKPITVVLNLKNKKRFERIGRQQYTLNRR